MNFLTAKYSILEYALAEKFCFDPAISILRPHGVSTLYEALHFGQFWGEQAAQYFFPH